jgi:glycosyltransferase involved in cell wall biosynthesis
MSGNYMGFIDHKRKVIEQADAIIAVSNATKHDILKFTNTKSKNISVIHHGINQNFKNTCPSVTDIEQFKTENQIKKPYWLFVGRRLRYKNFGTLLRAWAKVTNKYKIDSNLVAIGPNDGLESWQIDFLIKNRLESKIKLLSRVDDCTLINAYHGATAFIFPSLFEGFGIPLLEAMACNTPIIASNIPVFHEIAADAALFFDPHDEDSLTDAMIQILDGQLCQNLKKLGQKRLDFFSWEQSAQQVVKIYQELACNA